MAKTRLELSQTLKKICENCYFSPPSRLDYPCIIYERGRRVNHPADDIKYLTDDEYTLTLIDTNPDSLYVDEILSLDYCSLDRTYAKDNLNHFVFTLYW